MKLIIFVLCCMLWSLRSNGQLLSLVTDSNGVLKSVNPLTGWSTRIIDSMQLKTNYFDSVGLGGRATAKLMVVDSIYPSYPMPPLGTLAHFISANSNVNGRLTFTTYNNVGVQGAAFTGQRAMGYITNPLPPTSGAILAVLNGQGYGTSRWPVTSSGSVAIKAEATFSNVSKPTGISFLTAPTGDTINVERMYIASTGQVRINGLNSVGFVQTDASGNLSTGAAPSTDSTIFQTKYRSDTARANTYSAIAGKINAIDTAAMLSAYLRRGDTSAMLSPYLRTATAAATYATTSSVTGKLNVSDTASMLSVYQRKGDSATYQTKFKSDTGRINVYTSLAGKLSANQPITITATGDATGTSTSSGTAPSLPLTLANSGVTAGTYEQLTVDAKGRATVGYNPTITPNVTRAINGTTFTVSTTKEAWVAYNVTISCTATIGSAATGSLALQYSTNGGSTYSTVSTVSNSNTITLAVVLNSVQASGLQLCGYIPANALVKLVPTTVGTTTITYLTGFERF